MKKNPSILERELDFVASSKLRYNERFVRYLLMGMVADFDRARQGIDYFAQLSIEGKNEYSLKYSADASDQEIFTFIYDLLNRIVMEKIESIDKTIPVTLGVSSGYDSRSILLVLLKHNIPVITYTYGQLGNFDFDFSKMLFKSLKRRNIFFDTSKFKWSLKSYEQGIFKFQDYPISPRVITEQLLSDKYNRRYDLQGYLNDSLTGPRISSFGSDNWDLAIDNFCRANDQFKFQGLVSRDTLKFLLPEKPYFQPEILSLDRQLNFSFRQIQRIRPVGGRGATFITPFEDRRWVSFWLSRMSKDLEEQRFYLKFLNSLKENVFFDLKDKSTLERTALKKYNIKSTYSGLKLIDKAYSKYMRNKKLPSKPGAHFCLYTCYCNNKSFRNMINESIGRLKKRKVFKEIFIDKIWMDFEKGDATAAAMLNGLVSTDILIEVGVFDE